MHKTRSRSFVLTIASALLVLLSLPVAAEAWTRCYGDSGCRTCFFYSDDGANTYQGYMTYCPRPVY